MTIRWGILGCGDVVRKRVARAILDEPGADVVAACRRSTSELERFCAEFGVEHAYTRDTDLIEDSNVDVVYISTPVHLHAAQTQAAARAGKHVLVEKPMAMTVEECDAMIAACAQHNVKLGVAYYRRFYPMVHRMKELALSGAIGEVRSITAVTGTPFPFQTGGDGYWRVVPGEGGGGSLMDLGSHRLNLFLDMFGEVFDAKGICDTRGADYESENTASVIVRFASGVHGTLQCFFGTDVDPDEFSILGSRGRLFASPLNGSELVVQTKGERRVESHPPPANFNAPLIADFVEAIRDDREPRVSGAEGRRTNEVLALAYRAATA